MGLGEHRHVVGRQMMNRDICVGAKMGDGSVLKRWRERGVFTGSDVMDRLYMPGSSGGDGIVERRHCFWHGRFRAKSALPEQGCRQGFLARGPMTANERLRCFTHCREHGSSMLRDWSGQEGQARHAFGGTIRDREERRPSERVPDEVGAGHAGISELRQNVLGIPLEAHDAMVGGSAPATRKINRIGWPIEQRHEFAPAASRGRAAVDQHRGSHPAGHVTGAAEPA